MPPPLRRVTNHRGASHRIQPTQASHTQSERAKSNPPPLVLQVAVGLAATAAALGGGRGVAGVGRGVPGADGGGGDGAGVPRVRRERRRADLAVLFESLGHAATDDELSRMMAEADADGDGFSSLEEFAVLNATAAGDDDEDLRLAFNVFDADGSGAISAAELARVLLPAKCLRAALLLPAPAPARAPGPKVASSADASCFCSHCMCGLSLTLTKEGTPSTSRKTELHHMMAVIHVSLRALRRSPKKQGMQHLSMHAHSRISASAPTEMQDFVVMLNFLGIWMHLLILLANLLFKC